MVKAATSALLLLAVGASGCHRERDACKHIAAVREAWSADIVVSPSKRTPDALEVHARLIQRHAQRLEELRIPAGAVATSSAEFATSLRAYAEALRAIATLPAGATAAQRTHAELALFQTGERVSEKATSVAHACSDPFAQK